LNLALARGVARPFSVAPMMDWTDRHYRYLVRGLTRHALLYTEMITAQAIVHGDRERLLDFDASERPLALQLGGDDPALLAQAAAVGAAWGYDEINLNVGCPSDRVQRGRFGACLMAHPERVADSVRAMREAVALPVTVKHRLGIDDLDSDAHLHAFVAALVEAGVDRVVVHARKAWLHGLSPKENRSVPPLQPERVQRLKQAFPNLRIEFNGGVRTWEGVEAALRAFDGVMVGRVAIENPYWLAQVDARVFNPTAVVPTRTQVVERYLPYVEAGMARGVPWSALVKPLIPLVRDVAGGRAWRRTLSEAVAQGRTGPAAIERALAALPAAAA
jgi:tRNA-dihydrouridine synthase A